MKYALENIESLIQSELNPDVLTLKQPAGEVLSGYIIKITGEKALVRSVLIEEAFSLKKEKAVELLIQRYQSALINLADDIIQYIQIAEAGQSRFPGQELSVITVYHHTLKCIEELLTFIEKHFSRYFNIDERIPGNYKLLMQSKFREILKVLLKQYKTTNIDSGLLELMVDPFQKFIKADPLKEFTYRELLYLKTLHKEFSEILLPNQKIVVQKNMIDLMLYLNFNNYFFVNYYINIISKDINATDSIPQQIEQLAWWLKTISQVQTRPVVAYKQKDTSAKVQLIGWVTDEMTYLEKKHQLTLVTVQPMESLPKSTFSIMTSLSVNQLALMIRLLFDTGVLIYDNKTELLAKIAGVIKTGRKEKISPYNLRVRYYNIDAATKIIVKDWLFKMSDQIRKY